MYVFVLDPCEPNPCKNGAACKLGVSCKCATCTCPNGCSGNYCENCETPGLILYFQNHLSNTNILSKSNYN